MAALVGSVGRSTATDGLSIDVEPPPTSLYKKGKKKNSRTRDNDTPTCYESHEFLCVSKTIEEDGRVEKEEEEEEEEKKNNQSNMAVSPIVQRRIFGLVEAGK